MRKASKQGEPFGRCKLCYIHIWHVFARVCVCMSFFVYLFFFYCVRAETSQPPH